MVELQQFGQFGQFGQFRHLGLVGPVDPLGMMWTSWIIWVVWVVLRTRQDDLDHIKRQLGTTRVIWVMHSSRIASWNFLD